MADIFQTSVSGMLAYQQALATTSHNISNINTPGYSRQRVEFSTLTPGLAPGGWVGTGVGVDTIKRLADDLRLQTVRVNTSEYGRLNTFAELSGRIDNLLADKDAGLAPAMQAFFNSVQAASADPASAPTRNVMLTEAQNLASRFHFLDARLTELDAETNHRIELTVGEINEMADAVARLNRDISVALGRSQGAPPNDLLDQRDALLEQISARVGTQVVKQGDGMVSVFIGNGQALVTGAETNRLTVTNNEFDRARKEIAFASGSGNVNVTRNISGGTLGGLLDFRRESLDAIRNELGQTATALTMQFNQQHRLGVSFDGTQTKAGSDFFKPLPVQVLASERNSSNSAPTVRIDPDRLDALTSSDYRLQHNNGSWQLTRVNDGTSWSLPLSPGPDGLEIELPSSAGNGDSFLIRPTRGGALGMDVALTQPNQIAWANPVLVGEATGPNGEALNRGTGQLSKPSFTGDVSAYLQNGAITLTYSADADGAGNAGFIVNGDPANVVLYDGTPGSRTINVGGGTIRFELAGAPQAGDAFVIQPNQNGRGDNANLLALSELKDKPALSGGDASLQEFYSSLVGRAGAQTLRANVNRDAQEVLLDQAQAARDAISGVNLEEEAADMLRFQQAFQASAQLVVVANTLFQSLLEAVR
jgi:flagellar hook-associated protein 1 FlgK